MNSITRAEIPMRASTNPTRLPPITTAKIIVVCSSDSFATVHTPPTVTLRYTSRHRIAAYAAAKAETSVGVR